MRPAGARRPHHNHGRRLGAGRERQPQRPPGTNSRNPLHAQAAEAFGIAPSSEPSSSLPVTPRAIIFAGRSSLASRSAPRAGCSPLPSRDACRGGETVARRGLRGSLGLRQRERAPSSLPTPGRRAAARLPRRVWVTRTTVSQRHPGGRSAPRPRRRYGWPNSRGEPSPSGGTEPPGARPVAAYHLARVVTPGDGGPQRWPSMAPEGSMRQPLP